MRGWADEKFVIVESKWNTARLRSIVDRLTPGARIRQMSKRWIELDNRILRAVGGDRDLARRVLSNYVPVEAKIDLNGVITFYELDELEKQIGPWEPPSPLP